MKSSIESPLAVAPASPGQTCRSPLKATPINYRTHHGWALTLALFGMIGRCSAFITDGLVGNWPFDEPNGLVAAEASGNGLPGMLTNFPAGQGHWVAGQIGGALRFGGLSARQHVHVPDFTKPTTSLTVSAWVWADSLPQWATIAANWNRVYGALNYGLYGSNPGLSLYENRNTPFGMLLHAWSTSLQRDQ